MYKRRAQADYAAIKSGKFRANLAMIVAVCEAESKDGGKIEIIYSGPSKKDCLTKEFVDLNITYDFKNGTALNIHYEDAFMGRMFIHSNDGRDALPANIVDVVETYAPSTVSVIPLGPN